MKRLIGFFFLLAAILVPVLVQAEDETFLPYQQSGVDAANTNCEAFAAPGEPKSVNILYMLEDGYEPIDMVCAPDKTLYIAASNPHTGDSEMLVAVGPDGQERWKRLIPLLASAPAVESSGDIYVAAGTSVFRIAPDGRDRWVYQDGEAAFAGISLIPGHGLLTRGSWSSTSMLDPKGAKKWSWRGYYARPVPSAQKQLAFLGIGEKGIGLFILSMDGAEIRFIEAGRALDASFAGDGLLAVEFGRLRFFSLDGQSLWNWRHLDGIPRWPALSPNGNIYVCSDDGFELACHGRDGKVKWQTRGQLGSNMRPLAFSDSRVLICSTPGYGPLRVSLIDANGQSVWSKALPASGTGIPANALAAFSDGTIFVGLKNGRIYALKQR